MPVLSPVPPPTDYSAVDEAQIRLRAKPKFNLFRPRSSRRLSAGPPQNVSAAALPCAGPDPLIDLGPPSAASSVDEDQDQYRWAVVYENQRGIKLYSPHYSSFSLLPTDPAPFTTPNSSNKRSKQSDVSLSVYPLPDGAWRWLSPWMIDMRSDSGEVQHDGFEYNWTFRTHKWHPESGPMSWVRRRRWIRLMMRPAKRKDHKKHADLSSNPNTPITPAASMRNRYSVASSFPPSVLDSFLEDDSLADARADEVWLSDNDEENWEKCRILMRAAGRDGRILELWRRWLGDEPDPRDKRGKRKQWTEDDDPPIDQVVSELPPPPARPPPPPVANILPALRKHGGDILHSFIFPESRARFIEMLERVGVLPELNSDFGTTDVQFWSYLKDGIIPEDSV
ncbi:hypothetical protein DFH07DRAFT_789117 [Mycena maculata]|uniref:TECPR1-like DysF domain-containing protein n=1 Tax=Mycena maculata TaxID=230809 RepID=A0AAD7KFW0_9AGAR|nr:hypothetical protein DFH07DRAFT_789117 [Mycena maculata]